MKRKATDTTHSNNSSSSNSDVAHHLIIDTDAGVDDAYALMMCLHNRAAVTVAAVTCVGGNTHIDNVVENVSRVLTLMGRGADVPFYKGATDPLIGRHKPPVWDGHGADGLGNSQLPSTLARCPLQAAHAVTALLDMTRARPNFYTILALGPLTNLALAVKMDPGFASRVRQLYFMGGTSQGKGNTTGLSEFNIFHDPEAAHEVFAAFPMAVMVSWENTVQCVLPWSWYDRVIARGTSERARFLAKITSVIAAKRIAQDDGSTLAVPGRHDDEVPDNAAAETLVPNTHDGFVICDAVAAAVVCCEGPMVLGRSTHHVDVETGGRYCRGALSIEWYDHSKPDNLTVIDKVHRKTFQRLMEDMINAK